MSTKLNWEYEPAEDASIAWHNGYRIKAERDTHSANPFEDWDGEFPMVVRYDGKRTIYDKTKKGLPPDDPLGRFNDHQIVHNQIHIADIIGTDISTITAYYCEDGVVRKYINDADLLREAFAEELSNFVEGSQALKTWVALYELIDVPCLHHESRGYCQGDWAEVLIVATPEAIEEFGAPPQTPETLQGQAKLYDAWAWGDVYGYVIERPVVDEDGEVVDWEELDSCWGFYGSDHVESGLEEQALDAVPEEPAVSVRSSDELEDA